jgi:hypothetical protein
MPDLTDAQYLAAARALLGIKPELTHITAEFVFGVLSDVCAPERLKAALAVAFEAGRESALADHEVTHEWGTRFHFADREEVRSAEGFDEPEKQARFRARLNGLRADRTEVVRRARLTGPWEVQP